MENILVSACLLGVSCRYDQQSKPNVRIIALKDRYNLIPVCPEIMGGLTTPRMPSEIVDNKVIMEDGTDVTKQYIKGAEESLKLAKIFGCSKAILKEKSPSCGFGKIYDGSFSKRLKDGNGVTAEMLSDNGIEIFGESFFK